MNRAQMVRVTLADGAAVIARWQSAWINRPIVWDGFQWDYQQFDWGGLLSGQAGGEQATITLPATPSIRALAEQALLGAWLATIEVYAAEDDGTADAGPPEFAVLTSSTVGEVIGASGGLTSLTLTLGSALSPVGAQFPPRAATTALIGVPCRL